MPKDQNLSPERNPNLVAILQADSEQQVVVAKIVRGPEYVFVGLC